MKTNILPIVMGIGSYNDLGIIRSCGEAGLRSIYITEKGRDLVFPIHRSRYVIGYYQIEYTAGAILRTINNIKNKTDMNLVIFPAADNVACVLDSLYDQFSTKIHFSHASGRMSTLMDKAIMSSMANNAGLKVPRTFKLKTVDDMNNLPLSFPVIVKPLRSIDGQKSDIQVCSSTDEYFSTVKSYLSAGYDSLLVQEYIHSLNTQEIGVTGIAYPNGMVQIHGYINKIRNLFRINNFGVYEPHISIPCLNELKSYISDTGYIGIFDTDFIKDDDNFYFIECNFRNGAYGYCTTRAGFNMPKLFIDSWFNVPATDDKNLKRCFFMEERTDFLNIRAGHISFWKWVKDVMRTDVFLFWNLRDIRPYLRIPYFIKKYFVVKKQTKCEK